MRSLALTSFPTTCPPPDGGKLIRYGRITGGTSRNCSFISTYGRSSSLSLFSSTVRLRKSVIVAAKKEIKNSSDSKRIDRHSFVAKPDEATGPFPEAVLLKEKKVQEDGKLLPEFADAEEQKLWEALELKLESDLDVEQMRHYEVVYLIHEKHEEEVESVNSKVQDFIREKKGKIWRFSDWGVRRLAYKIQKAKNAHYILMNFEIEAKSINDFKTMLDKDERVIRHLVMKKDEVESQECPPPPEFHTLQAGTDDDDDIDDIDVEYDDDDEDYDDEEEDYDDDEEEEEEEEEEENDNGDDEEEEVEEEEDDDDDDTENGVIVYVDDELENKRGKVKPRTEKVSR